MREGSCVTVRVWVLEVWLDEGDCCMARRAKMGTPRAREQGLVRGRHALASASEFKSAGCSQGYSCSCAGVFPWHAAVFIFWVHSVTTSLFSLQVKMDTQLFDKEEQLQRQFAELNRIYPANVMRSKTVVLGKPAADAAEAGHWARSGRRT